MCYFLFVFAKKTKSKIVDEKNIYTARVHSFTKNVDNVILTEHSEYKWQTIDECNSNNKITTKTLATLNIANFNKQR